MSLRGCVFRQILFNVSVNGVESGPECTLSQFGTEVSDEVDSLEGRDGIQRDINRLEDWASEMSPIVVSWSVLGINTDSWLNVFRTVLQRKTWGYW